MNVYKIAVIAGDGIGPEVIDEGVKVLNEVSKLDGNFKFDFTYFPWGCNYYLKNGCMMLITGEDLGQVASQTMPAIGCTDAVSTLPVFRPLIGMDKQEIVEISEKIGTFETSILPYEDCCTVFTPRHPKTRPTIEMIEEAEKALDIEALIDRCEINHQRLRLFPKN